MDRVKASSPIYHVRMIMMHESPQNYTNKLAPMKLSTKFWPVNILVIYIKVVEYTPGRGIHRDMPTGSVCVCVNINSHGDFNISSVHISNLSNLLVYIYTQRIAEDAIDSIYRLTGLVGKGINTPYFKNGRWYREFKWKIWRFFIHNLDMLYTYPTLM